MGDRRRSVDDAITSRRGTAGLATRGGATMSDLNKSLVERFVEEFWNRGKLKAADELMAPDAVVHLPTGETVDREALKSFNSMWRQAFPDWHSTCEALIAEGDAVGERWTAKGTHRG